MRALDVPDRADRADDRSTVADAGDLREVYERYHHHVFRLALRYGAGSVPWAEDVTHDVFVRLLSARVNLDAREDLFGWFYRVTTRRCLNRLRHEALLRSAPVRWLLSRSQEPVHTPEASVVARDELEHVAEVVRRLPVKERVAFYMKHVDGKSQVEIAGVMGHSTGYVSKLLGRAKKRLGEAGWELPDDE